MPLLSFRYDELRDPMSAMCESLREQHRKTLRQAIHVWLDQYPADFHEPPNYPCLSHLEKFCARVMPESELDLKVRNNRKAALEHCYSLCTVAVTSTGTTIPICIVIYTASTLAM